jgi:hypothetical protein
MVMFLLLEESRYVVHGEGLWIPIDLETCPPKP